MVEANNSRDYCPNRDHIFKLWRLLLDSEPGPSNKDLRYLVEFVDTLRDVAAEELTKRDPDIDDLRLLLRFQEANRDSIAGQILDQSDDIYDLVRIAVLSKTHRQRALGALPKEISLDKKFAMFTALTYAETQITKLSTPQVPNDGALSDAQDEIEELIAVQESAFRILTTGELNIQALINILHSVKSYRARAADVLASSDDEEGIVEAIKWIPEAGDEHINKRGEYWNILKSRGVTQSAIRELAIYDSLDGIYEEAFAIDCDSETLSCLLSSKSVTDNEKENIIDHILRVEYSEASCINVVKYGQYRCTDAAVLVLENEPLGTSVVTIARALLELSSRYPILKPHIPKDGIDFYSDGSVAYRSSTGRMVTEIPEPIFEIRPPKGEQYTTKEVMDHFTDLI